MTNRVRKRMSRAVSAGVCRAAVNCVVPQCWDMARDVQAEQWRKYIVRRQLYGDARTPPAPTAGTAEHPKNENT